MQIKKGLRYMLNGLIKNIMVKSIVTILLSTSTIGNTTTETKTVEDIDDNNTTKIEEKVNEEVVKEAVVEEETEIKTEEATKEEVIEEEEDIYEWKNEVIAEEIANNPNFEEQYNDLLNIYNDYRKLMNYRNPRYDQEKQRELEDLWGKEWEKQLYAMDLDENSILDELRVALIALVKLDYGDEHCYDIISRINNNL